MREQTIGIVVTLSLTSGVIIIGMILYTIRSLVRLKIQSTIKLKCIAAGMNAADIERVILVGELQRCTKRIRPVENDYEAIVEKKPPVLVGATY